MTHGENANAHWRGIDKLGGIAALGTLLGFFLVDLAGPLISFVMLRSQVFGRLTAYAGMLGFSLLLIFEMLVSHEKTRVTNCTN